MKTFISTLVSFIILLTSYNTCATVTIGGTRILYDGSKKEASLRIHNPDNSAYLIQTVVGNLGNEKSASPFIVTPPLFRLDGGKENLLRIIMSGNLPQDRESMYWLRIKAIPSAPHEKNIVQIAIATSIKLIYRPQALKNVNVEKESSKLIWHVSHNNLDVTNPTPYFINFNEIEVGGKKITNASYAAPNTTTTFILPSGMKGGSVRYSVIGDFGAVSALKSTSL